MSIYAIHRAHFPLPPPLFALFDMTNKANSLQPFLYSKHRKKTVCIYVAAFFLEERLTSTKNVNKQLGMNRGKKSQRKCVPLFFFTSILIGVDKSKQTPIFTLSIYVCIDESQRVDGKKSKEISLFIQTKRSKLMTIEAVLITDNNPLCSKYFRLVNSNWVRCQAAENIANILDMSRATSDRLPIDKICGERCFFIENGFGDQKSGRKHLPISNRSPTATTAMVGCWWWTVCLY